jgi:Tfp pilus assembly protein PilX
VIPTARRRARASFDERGVALVLTLLVLLVLGGLLAAYLGVSTLEPQISRNLADASRARHLAEAGIERGFNVLVATTDAAGGWSDLLASATTARPWVALPGLTNAAIGAAGAGTFSVSIRNDNGAADTPLTGLSATTRPVMDTSPTADDNKTIIVRSIGTFNGVTKTVEVVVQRAALPPLAGAINIPGPSPTTVVDAAALDIDGRDYGCAGGTSCDAPSSWAVTSNPLKYGIAVRPGAQGPIESALASPAAHEAIKGRSRTDPAGSYTTGRDAVAADASLTPARIDEFVGALASNPATSVLQSTPACPLVVTGGASATTNTPTLGNGCGMNAAVNLGSRHEPRLVFVRGDLTLDRGLKGAGILVVQDGGLTTSGDLEWDGLVIVAGRGSSMTFASAGRTAIRGATIASESGSRAAGGTVEFAIGGAPGSLSIRASAQNVAMAQGMRALHSITNWRES